MRAGRIVVALVLLGAALAGASAGATPSGPAAGAAPGLGFGTCLAAEGYDLAWRVAVDGNGSSYVVGETASPDLPTTPGSFMPANPPEVEQALTVVTPAELAGLRGPVVHQVWSAPLDPPVSAPLVEAATVATPDGDARGDLGCDLGADGGANPFPVGSLDGRILVVDRGTCVVVQKAANAAEAGAEGVIVVMGPGQAPFAFASDGTTVAIPAVSVGLDTVADLRAALASGTAVVVRLDRATVPREGGLDVFVAKLDPRGALVWSTFLGGDGDCCPRPPEAVLLTDLGLTASTPPRLCASIGA